MLQGWIYISEISYYEALLLYNALKRHKDSYNYHPIAMAKRDEIGMKYRFLCIAKPISNSGATSHFANIEVYKPVTGMPYVTHLQRLNFDQLFS